MRTNINSLLSPLLVILALFAAGCSDLPQPGVDDKHEGDGGKKSGSLEKETPTEEPKEDVTQFSLGLPDFCSLSENEGPNTCFKCTPRELPVISCAERAIVDPALQCQHNDDGLECGEFKFGYGTRNQAEKLYEKIPIIFIGVQLLIDQKLGDQPEKKKIFDNALELFRSHALNIFSGENKDKVLADLKALTLKAKPDIDPSSLELAESEFSKIWDLVDGKRRSGNIGQGDVVAMAMAFLSTMPEVKALLGNGLDLGMITKFLDGGDVNLSALLEGFGSADYFKDEEESKDDETTDEAAAN